MPGLERPTPMMAASNIHYDIADRTRAIAAGGIGAIHLLDHKIGLVDDINHNLQLLKRHLPYHESDHVLAIASNILLLLDPRMGVVEAFVMQSVDLLG